MKVMSPERCLELLEQRREGMGKAQAKLQIMLEYFQELADGGEEREFENLSLLARGFWVICDEVITNIKEYVDDDIDDAIRVFSPDPLKVKEYVDYYRSIGIRNETLDIEFEKPEKPIKPMELGDV